MKTIINLYSLRLLTFASHNFHQVGLLLHVHHFNHEVNRCTVRMLECNPDLLGSKADHDGPRSACSIRSPQSAFLRNPVRVFISKNKNVNGQLRKFVEKILKTIMLSEAEVERVFSRHKSIHTKLRDQLSPEIVEKILFVQYGARKLGDHAFSQFPKPVQTSDILRNLNLTNLVKLKFLNCI